MVPRKLFRDRADAGKRLAAHLGSHRHDSPLVLGLPRGGVPVAFEIARTLEAPLDVCVVRKLGAPLEPEHGIGAVGEDGTVYVDRESMRRFGVSEDELAASIEAKRAAIDDEVERFRSGSAPLDVRGRTVIVVDDGVATGGTARAALLMLRSRGAGFIVLAVPVGASETLDELTAIADEIVCLHPEDTFYAVSPWYEDFTPTSEDTVRALLHLSQSGMGSETRVPPRHSERVRATRDENVRIPIDDEWLDGRLTLPAEARGIVLLPHGGGRARAQHQHLARSLHEAKLATLRLDLLTQREDELDARIAHLRSDVALLASRLVTATDWTLQHTETRTLNLGYFGANVVAAAALIAAAHRPGDVGAIVARGGQLDLARGTLGDVQAPTLLLVGGLDAEILQLNRESLYFLTCKKRLEIVHDASHGFQEPGALELAAHAAAAWFVEHLRASESRATA
jgi:putative phosphoribosyl transferase